MTITITRTGDTTRSASVRYSFLDGTAVNGSDFTGTNGLMSFAAGETARSFTVAITNDIDSEGNETFSILLSEASNANLGNPVNTVVTIIDNDKRRGRFRSRDRVTLRGFKRN